MKKHKFVQIKNPRTGTYIIINTKKGKIIDLGLKKKLKGIKVAKYKLA